MSQKKIRVGIVFGGRSGEHEVSLASAKDAFLREQEQMCSAVNRMF